MFVANMSNCFIVLIVIGVMRIRLTFLSAAFVDSFFGRTYWRRFAFTLNSKCNPATAFPEDLKDAKILFENGWLNRVSLRQPAGEQVFLCSQKM